MLRGEKYCPAKVLRDLMGCCPWLRGVFKFIREELGYRKGIINLNGIFGKALQMYNAF